MAVQGSVRSDRRGPFVMVVLAVLAALALAIMLYVITGGLLVAVLAAGILIAVVGSLHYLVWGRMMVGQAPTVYSRRQETAATEFPDNFTLALDERERQELLTVLDQVLPVEAVSERRAVLAGVRQRLERYGA